MIRLENYQNNIKKQGFKLACIAFIFCMSVLVPSIVKAEVTYPVEQLLQDNNFARNVLGTNIVPTEDLTISGFSYYKYSGSSGELLIHLCKGTITSNFFNSSDCGSYDFIASTTCGEPTSYQFHDCYFPENHELENGENYFYILSHPNNVGTVGTKARVGSNPLAGANLFGANDAITDYHYPNYDLTFKLFFDSDTVIEYIPLPVESYYNVGGYTVPKSVSCYENLDYCDFVFGYDINAYSRAITEADPANQVYPNFSWWWPDVSASESIYSATLRRHIDTGQELYVMFDFDTPTSTTQYVLELSDPVNEDIGSSSLFVIDVNLITATSSVFSSCLGTCDDGLLGDIFCGIKQAVCFFVSPSDNSSVYINSGFNKLKHAPPFSLVTDITDAMIDGLEQENDKSAFFSVPMITATGTYYMLPILDASSTEMVIGKTNATLLRSSLVWIMYIVVGLGILLFLINRSK